MKAQRKPAECKGEIGELVCGDGHVREFSLPAGRCAVMVGPPLVATVVSVEFVEGLPLTWVGNRVNAIMVPAVARISGREIFEVMSGTKERGFACNGIVVAVLLRDFSSAPFSGIKLAFGASSICFGDFMMGTMRGLIPEFPVLTLLGDRLRKVLRVSSTTSLALFCGALLLHAKLGTGPAQQLEWRELDWADGR